MEGRTGAELRGRAQERDRTEVKVRNRMVMGGGGSMGNSYKTEGKDSNRTERTWETNRMDGEGKTVLGNGSMGSRQNGRGRKEQNEGEGTEEKIGM